MFDFINQGTVVVFAAIAIIALVVAYIGSRYKVAGANEALIRSGRAAPGAGAAVGLKVVRGGGVIVLPLFHKLGKLKLTARQINVNLADAVTRQGIKVAVQGVATFKIGADEESIRNAAERFLESDEEEVDSIVKNVLEGSLRSIVGTLTVEELNLDRQKFQQAVQDAAKGDLATSGLIIDSFTIQAIGGEALEYMELVGQQELSRRERDARMAKATADQEAAVREAEAQQIKLNAARDVALREAEVQTQTQAAQARAAQAGPLAQAEAQQEVTRKLTELAQLEADRKAKELLTSTVRPAEAEAEATVKRADGERLARIAAAQAEAERVKLAGEAEAAVTFAKGEAAARITTLSADADAHKVEVEGNAEAAIVFAKGDAEAKALALKADAYRQFNDAAVLQTVLSMLPEIVRAAAEPIGKIQSLTVLSSDGANDLVKTTTETLTQASTTIKGLTGIDLPAVISGALGGSTSSGDEPPPPSGVTRIPPRGGPSGSGSTSGSGMPQPSGASPAAAPTAPTRRSSASGRRVAEAAEGAAVNAAGSAEDAAASAADAAASAASMADSAAQAASSAASAVDAASQAVTRVSQRVSRATEPTS
jgi:flotillin